MHHPHRTQGTRHPNMEDKLYDIHQRNDPHTSAEVLQDVVDKGKNTDVVAHLDKRVFHSDEEKEVIDEARDIVNNQ